MNNFIIGIVIGALALVIIISIIIMAILLYNFMQLLSTLNKRMVAVISDILGNIDLSTPKIDSMIGNNSELNLEDVLEDSQEDETNGFNPHNYDPFKEENNE